MGKQQSHQPKYPESGNETSKEKLEEQICQQNDNQPIQIIKGDYQDEEK